MIGRRNVVRLGVLVVLVAGSFLAPLPVPVSSPVLEATATTSGMSVPQKLPDTKAPRAVFGQLREGEVADLYVFSMPDTREVRIVVQVPAGVQTTTFRPDARIIDDLGQEVADLRDPGDTVRERAFETFTLQRLYRGGVTVVELEADREYRLVVTPGDGDRKRGRYSISIGGCERNLRPLERLEAAAALPRLWLELYG